MQAAVFQSAFTRGAPAANAALVADAVRAAGAAGCTLAAFPECALTGYVFEDRAALAAAALPLDGPETATIAAACREAGVHAVVGLFEAAEDGTSVYNTAALIGPAGLVGRHRKRHLPFLGGDRFADRPLDLDPPVFDTPAGRIGIAICYEIRFPEVVRTLALSGAEIVVLPTNWPLASRILAEHFAPVRAAENFVYFLVANRNDREDGTQFLGASQIVDPSGTVLVHAGAASGLFTAEIDLARARDKTIVFEAGAFEVAPFRDRRPETYRI